MVTKSTTSSIAGELNQQISDEDFIAVSSDFWAKKNIFGKLQFLQVTGDRERPRAHTINDLRSLFTDIHRQVREHDAQQLQRIEECAPNSVASCGGGNSSPEFEQMSAEKALIIQAHIFGIFLTIFPDRRFADAARD